MNVLGNDVVDLTVDMNKHLNQRFTNRVLSTIELEVLDKSLDKNLFLWSLWATKEASYKACQKMNHQLLFSPSQFALDEHSLNKLLSHDHKQDFYATLQHQNTLLQLKLCWENIDLDEKPEQHITLTKPTAVHATAMVSTTAESLNQVQVVIARMSQANTHKNQSSEVRTLAKNLLQSHDISANIHRPAIKVKDYTKPGPPILVDNEQNALPHEISLSHDGEWLAVALMA